MLTADGGHCVAFSEALTKEFHPALQKLSRGSSAAFTTLKVRQAILLSAEKRSVNVSCTYWMGSLSNTAPGRLVAHKRRAPAAAPAGDNTTMLAVTVLTNEGH